MGQNLVEKIVQRHALGLDENQKVKIGDFISISPAHVMTHDNTGAVIPKFKSIGATKFAKPEQVVFTLDHNIQDKSDKNLEKYNKIENFSKQMSNHFFPAGRGIGHQVMIEEGFVWPGTMVVASDSHSNMYGGIGALGTPIVRTDAAAIWATGKTWWKIPKVTKVLLNGKLNKHVTGKDIIIALCGTLNKDEVLNNIIEFDGEVIKELSIEQRLSISNMTTEWGALGGIFPVDEVTLKWIENMVNKNKDHKRWTLERFNEIKNNIHEYIADKDAFYNQVITIDVSNIAPSVAGPNSVKNFSPVTEIKNKKIKIDKAYIVSCVNSRKEDLIEAAKVLHGKKIAENVKLYVGAASSIVEDEVKQEGYWKTFIDAGAEILPPGCGPCIGLGKGLLEENEVGISATNRNFKGRMGHPDSVAYLASPAVVASSAINGFITYDDETNITGNIKFEIAINKDDIKSDYVTKLISNFPKKIKGRLIFCPKDNMNTDGIYPGKYTYQDDITPEKQAEVVMENYDPDFSKNAKAGDILVGGFTFGTGSSREQAATALKYKGIQLLIAGSYSATYLRNAINNGFLCLEIPAFVEYLKKELGTEKLTYYTESDVEINFETSKLNYLDKEFNFAPVGTAAQEIIVKGGLENWVKNELNKGY